MFRRLVRELIETALLALLMFIALEFSIQNFRVEGSSMEKTLSEDHYLFVNKLVYARIDTGEIAHFIPPIDISDVREVPSWYPFHAPEHGEVVIFRFPVDPTRDFVKRIIGVPGDHIRIEDGTVFRNGTAVDEPYIHRPDGRSYRPVTVPPDHYYVLGDNRLASNDSRAWGLVPAENIVGRAWLRYWPLQGVRIVQ